MKSIYVNNSYVNLGKKFLDESKDITFFFYIKLEEDSGGSIIAQNNDGSSAYRFDLYLSAKAPSYIFLGGASPQSTSAKEKLPSNRWLCMACVLSDKKTKVYVDGNLIVEKSTPRFYNDNTYLFAYERGKRNFLKAYIADFRIYDYALTDEEINEKLWIKETDKTHLLRHYEFENIYDTNKIKDSTGNYDITVNGFNHISDDIPELTSFHFLIKNSNKILKLSSTGELIDTTLAEPLTKEDFETHGFQDLQSLLKPKSEKSMYMNYKNNLEEGKVYSLNINRSEIPVVEKIQIL